MGVTIEDVAKLAGVSKATVSRVLNNHPNIRPETYYKVKDAIETLGYYPNSIGRSFANQNTSTIGLIVDVDDSNSFGNPFFYQVQYGIEKALCAEGYYLLIVNQKEVSDPEESIAKLVFEKRVDGLILPESIVNSNLVAKIQEIKFPFVVIGSPAKSFDVSWVDVDNKSAGFLATEHLIENGFKKINFICGSLKDKFNEYRFYGYKEALNKNSIFYDSKSIHYGISTKEEGKKITEKLFTQQDKPDALIFTSNLSAFGALEVIKDKNIKIPNEVGLVSFDNDPIAELTDPQLTTIDINVFDLGFQAARLLISQIMDSTYSNQNYLLPVNLIVRGTSQRIV